MSFAAEFWESRFPILHQKEMEIASQQQLKGLADNRLRESLLRSSGTIVFAFKYHDGAILAADRRMLDGWYTILSDAAIKIKQLTKFSAMASAGTCSVIKYLEENMETVCNVFERYFQRELSPDGQVRHLSNLMEKWWFLFLEYLYLGLGAPILVAYNKASKKTHLFSFGEDGFHFEHPFLIGTGCGFKAVQGLIIDQWRRDMDASSAIDLSLRAMLCSGVTSHGVSDARIANPIMALIDKRGFKWVSEEKISEKKVELSKREGLRCLLP